MYLGHSSAARWVIRSWYTMQSTSVVALYVVYSAATIERNPCQQCTWVRVVLRKWVLTHFDRSGTSIYFKKELRTSPKWSSEDPRWRSARYKGCSFRLKKKVDFEGFFLTIFIVFYLFLSLIIIHSAEAINYSDRHNIWSWCRLWRCVGNELSELLEEKIYSQPCNSWKRRPTRILERSVV